MDTGEKKNLWPFLQSTRPLPVGVAAADVLVQCPKSSLGARVSVPNGRGIGVLLEPSLLCALGVTLSGVAFQA